MESKAATRANIFRTQTKEEPAMKLFFNMASPFVRKVRVFARETGLDKNIEEITTMVSPVQENPALAQANPLKKIPALTLDDGTTGLRLARDLRIPGQPAFRQKTLSGYGPSAVDCAQAAGHRRRHPRCWRLVPL
jgi:hypothetical protein